jgi:hypothetical protein
MSNRQILYQADIQRTRRSLKLGVLVLIIVAAIGFTVCLLIGPFSGKIFMLGFIGLVILGGITWLREICKWNRTPGCYQIHLDSIGLHVHSDEPRLGKSFSVAAMNLHQLVQKRVGGVENLEYEYYVVEKSGKRHKISAILSNYKLDTVNVFERIACEYPSVEIVEEGL